MERSMVQQLNFLSSSQFLNNRTTFISTAFNEGDYQLRKSRIQNLPGYRRQDMSNKVNFVVVFQSIEIERLSNQVEALRIALKDAERQNFNIKNYEIQIRQLTQKCFAYERQRQQYRDEIDKLNMICEKLYEQLENMKVRFSDIDPTIKEKFKLQRERTQRLEEELQKWRARYSALESSKNREMEDMRLMMQSQRKSMIDRQIKQLTLKFNGQRQNLEKEIRKMREALDSKDNEIQRLKGRISQLQILNQELRGYQQTIDEYENKFAMISQQTVRLNDLLRHKQEDIEKLCAQTNNYKRRIPQLQKKIRQVEEGGEKVRALEEQIRQWKLRYSKIQDQNKQYKQDLAKVPQLQRVIQQINSESDRMKDAVRQKMGQIQDWRNRYVKVETQFKENKVQQQQKIPVLQSKLNQVKNENDRLNNALKSRAVQLENWRTKYNDSQKQLARLPKIQEEKRNLQTQINSQVRQINQLQTNIRLLEPQVKKLADVQQELNRQKVNKQESKKQIERLNNAVRIENQKSSNLQKKCLNLEKDLRNFSQIQEELRIYKQKEVNLTRQIDRINGIINEKIKQIQSLKETFLKLQKGFSQYQSVEKKLMDSVNQTQKLIHDLDESRKQTTFLHDKLFSSEAQNRKLKNDVFVLSQQKQQIVRTLNSRVQQLEQAKIQTSQLQSQISQLRQKQAKLRQIEDKLRLTENSLNDIDRKLKNEQNRSRELGQNFEQTNAELAKIKREGMMTPAFKEQFFQMRTQSQQRQRQFRNLQQRFLTIQSIMKKMRDSILKQDQVAKRNTQKLSSISKQFDTSAQNMKKFFDMQNQILKLNEQNMQLEGKVHILGLQNSNLKQSQIFSSRTYFDSEKDLTNLDFQPGKRSESFKNNYQISVNKGPTYSNNIGISNVKTSSALSPSNYQNTQGSVYKLQAPLNYSYNNQTINSISSVNTSKLQTFGNSEPFKKNASNTEYSISEPIKFQFKTSNSRAQP